MVALPCGSRSTSSTLRPDCASAAARFTLVVVLPTPPFWFTTANTRATSASRGAKHEVALRIEQRHAQFHGPAAGSVAFETRFHRGKRATGRHEMPTAREEIGELSKGARDDHREAPRRAPAFDAAFMHAHVRQA